MSPTQSLVVVYLPVLGVVFPISELHVTGEIVASVPRQRCHAFVCPPLTSGSGVVLDGDLTTPPPSCARALAITDKGRGARNTSPASRATPS